MAALLAMVAIMYPVWRGLIAPTPEVDFRFYWFAGDIWAHGLDPYSSAFDEFASGLIPPGSHWFYPPNWWPFSRALALFDFPTALKVWRASVPVILIVSTGSVVALLTRGLPSTRRALLIAGACALATAIEPTGDVLTGGQVSPILVYAGMALIICSFITSRRALLVAGLVLVSLKPQIGIVIFLAFALSRAHWRALAYALAVILVLSLPQLLSFGVVTSFREMLTNLHDVDQVAGNIPLAMTGPSHLFARAGLDLPLGASFILAFLTAVAAGLMLQRDPRSLRALALLLAGVAAFVPLHNYDMTILVLVAAVLLKVDRSRLSKLLIAAALLLIVRPSRIEALFKVAVYNAASGGVILYSAASLVLFALAVRAALGSREASGDRSDAFFSAAVTGRSTNR
jgi:hypothetical protein